MTTPFDDPQAELAWMFLQCICERVDPDEYFGLLSDDFTYWTSRTGKSVDKQTLRQKVERRTRDVHIALDLIRCINEGESVVIEAHGQCVAADGTPYESPAVFLVDTHDGQIVSIREYTDTRFNAAVLG